MPDIVTRVEKLLYLWYSAANTRCGAPAWSGSIFLAFLPLARAFAAFFSWRSRSLATALSACSRKWATARVVRSWPRVMTAARRVSELA